MDVPVFMCCDAASRMRDDTPSLPSKSMAFVAAYG